MTCIERDDAGKAYIVHYVNLLDRPGDVAPSHKGNREQPEQRGRCQVRGRVVFLCAGAINTTGLLLRNRETYGRSRSLLLRWAPTTSRTLTRWLPFSIAGSHRRPTTVQRLRLRFCSEPQKSTRPYMLDFQEGLSLDGRSPRGGECVRGTRSGATATLVHEPVLTGESGIESPNPSSRGLDAAEPAPGTRVRGRRGTVLQRKGDSTNASSGASAAALVPRRGRRVSAESEPLVGVFRSPLWLRRNRYRETGGPPVVPPRRPPTRHLRVEAFADALGGAARRGVSSKGAVERSFALDPAARTRRASGKGAAPRNERPKVPSVLDHRIGKMLPPFFAQGITGTRNELFEQAAALAMPLLGQLLGNLSERVAAEIDPRDDRKPRSRSRRSGHRGNARARHAAAGDTGPRRQRDRGRYRSHGAALQERPRHGQGHRACARRSAALGDCVSNGRQAHGTSARDGTRLISGPAPAGERPP